MRGKDIIVTFNEPWYNDYSKRLYTQLSEQMIREEIERVHKEPIITNTAFDEAATKGPIITLRVELEDIPSGLKVLRIRMQLVAKSTFGAAEPFKYKDGTSYFDIDATSTTNSFTLSKEVVMELVDYVAGILPPSQESNAPDIEMWIQFEMLAINVTNTTNLVAQSNSENWTSNVTLQQSGRWARVNTTGRLRRFRKGDEGLDIDILIGQQ